MGERLLELIFRHKFLLALPVVLGLVGGIFTLSLANDQYYASRAGIWVERPTDLTGGSFTEFNDYATPAQNQGGAMRELLGVDAFASDIVELANSTAAPGTPELTIWDVRLNTYIYPGGEHLLYVESRAATPQQAKDTVLAVVGTYSNLYTAQIKDKATRAKMFYEEQLNSSRKTLEEATSALRTYASGNPQLANVNLDEPPSSALRDFEFARLSAAAQTSRANYDELLEKFADSQISANAVAGTIPNFLILDEPVLPTTPVHPGKRALIMPPMLGLASGMFVSAVAFVIYWRLDRRIHLADDLAFLGPSIPVMTLPAAASRRRKWPSRFVRVAAAMQNGLRHSPAAVTE